jgi:Outer membrane protein beta-barrel domain
MEPPMNRMPRMLLAVVGAGALGAATPSWADNPLGVYVGAGAGVGMIENSGNYYDLGYYGSYHDHEAAWKVMAGVRPLPFFGVEAQYLDFGSANGVNGYYGSYYYANASSHPKAAMLYGVGYLPLPFLDVYAKLGAARLQTDITSYQYPNGYCPPPYTTCSAPVAQSVNQTDTRFAYGAGVQTRFQDFAFRAEYERIDSQFGDPAAFTVGVTWTF